MTGPPYGVECRAPFRTAIYDRSDLCCSRLAPFFTWVGMIGPPRWGAE